METATTSSGKNVTPHVGRNLTTYNVKRHNFTKNKSLGQVAQRKGKMNWSVPTSIKLPPSTSSKTPSLNSEENALFSASAFYGSKSKESPQKKCFNFVLLSNQVVMKKQMKMYACDVCSAVYRHVFSLKRHFLRNHVTVKYISKSDLSNCKIITHDQPDSALIANDSDESSLSSRSSESKKRHRSGELANLNEGMEGLYRCHLCPDLKFDTKLELKSHYSLHPKSSKVRFPCSKCGAVFSHKQTLLRHLLTHATSNTFPCKTCSKRFDNKASYLKHAYTHTDSRRCKYCSKILSTSANKRRHERIHEGLKPYPCKRCDAQFSQSGDLKKHLKLQHQVSYFSCTLCRAVFSSKIALTKHTTDSHASEIIPKNPNSEVLPSSTTNHVQFSKEVKEKPEVIAPKTFSCTVCKKVCPTYISMLRHRRQNHPFLHTRKVHKKLKFSQNTCRRILRRRRNSPQRTEEDFYLSISSMIADNLLNHVDGKTSQLSLRQYNFTEQMEQCTPIPTHPWSCYNFPSNFDVDLALRNRGHEIKSRSCESILPFTDTYAPNGFECFNCDSNGVYDFSNYYNSEVSDSEDWNNNCGSSKLTDSDVEERKKLIGREIKSVLVCCACKDRFSSREAFNDHCENNHPNVLCTYVEIEGDSESPPVVPENLSWQYLSPVGVYFSCSVPPPISEKPSISCTKCMSVFSTAPELHQHIVHCGGIQTPVKHVRKLFPERKIKRTMKSRIDTSLKPRFAENKVSKPEEAPQVPKATSSNLDMHSKMYKNLMDFRPKPSVGRPRLNLCINCPHCTQTFRTKTLLNAHISGCYRSKFHKRKYSRTNHVLNQKGTSTSSECSKSSDHDNHLLTNKGKKKLSVVNPHQTELKQKTLTFQVNKTLQVNAGQGTLGNSLQLNKQSRTTSPIPPQSSTKSPQNTASLPVQIMPLPKSVKHKPKEASVNDKPVVRESLTMHIALLPTPTIKRMSSKEAPLTPVKELALKTFVKPKECVVNTVSSAEQPMAAQPTPLPKLSLKHKLPKGTGFNSAFRSPKSIAPSNRPTNHPAKSSTSLTASPTKPLTEQKTLKQNSESSQTANESSPAQPMLTGVISNASNSPTKPNHTLKETVSKSIPSVGDLLPNAHIALDSVLAATKENLVPVKKTTKLSDASTTSTTVPLTGFKCNTNVVASVKDPLSTGTGTDEANVLNLTGSSIKKASTTCKAISEGQTSIKEASNIPNVSSSKPEETMFIPVASTAKDSMSNDVSGMSASICPTLTIDVNNHPVDPKMDSPRERLSPSLEVLINSINEKLHSDELSPSNPTFSWMEDEHIIVPLSKRFLSSSSLHPEIHQENLVPSTELDEIKRVVNDVIGKVEYRVVQDLSPPELEPQCKNKPSIDNVLKDFEFKFKEIGIPVPKEILSQVSSAILPSTSSDFPLKMSFKLTADESNNGTSAIEQPITKKPLGLRSFRRSRKRSIPGISNISLSKEISSPNSRILNHEKPKQNKPIRCSLCLLDFKYTMNYKRHLKSCRDKHLEKDNPDQPSKSPCVLHLPKKDEVEESMLNLLRHQSRQSQIMKEAKPDDTDDGKRLHTYTCDICHKIFLSLFKLLQHRVVHKLQNADDTGLAGNDNASPERSLQIRDQTVDDNQEKENSSTKKSVSKISNESSEVDTKTSSDVHVLLQHMVRQITYDAGPNSAMEGEQSITESPESQNIHENNNREEFSSASNHCIVDLSSQEKNPEPIQDIPSGSVDALNVIPVKEIVELEANKGISDQNHIAAETVIDDNKNNLTSNAGGNFKEQEIVLERELLEPIKNENATGETTKGAEYQEPPILEEPMDLSQPARLKVKRNVFTHAKPGARARKRCWGRKNWIIRKTHVKSTSMKKKTKTTSTLDIVVMPQTVIPSTSNDQKKPVVKRRFNKITTKQKPVQKRKRKKMRRDLSTLILRSGLSKSKPTGTKQTINSHIKIRRKYKKTIIRKKAMKKVCDLKTDETPVLEIPDFPPQEVVIVDGKPPKPLKRRYRRRKLPIKSVSINANDQGNIKPTLLVTESSSAADGNSAKHSQVLEPDKTPQPDNGNFVVKMRKKRKKVKKIVVRKRGGLKIGQIVKKSPVEIPTTSTAATTNLVQDIAESKPKVKRGRKKVIKSEFPPEKLSSSNTLSNIEDIKDTNPKPVIKSVKRRKNSTRFNSVDIQDGKNDSLHDSSPTASSLPVTIKIEVESEVSDLEKGDDKSILMAPIVSKPPSKKPSKMRGRPPNKKCPFCQKVFYSLNYKKRHIEMKHKGQKRKEEKVATKAKLLKKKRRAFKRQCKTGPASKKVRETKIALPLKKK